MTEAERLQQEAKLEELGRNAATAGTIHNTATAALQAAQGLAEHAAGPLVKHAQAALRSADSEHKRTAKASEDAQAAYLKHQQDMLASGALKPRSV